MEFLLKTPKKQHTGNEALAHFLLSINRHTDTQTHTHTHTHTHRHTHTTPPSSSICQHEILMPLLLFTTYMHNHSLSCTTCLHTLRHTSAHSPSQPSHMGLGRCYQCGLMGVARRIKKTAFHSVQKTKAVFGRQMKSLECLCFIYLLFCCCYLTQSSWWLMGKKRQLPCVYSEAAGWCSC